MVKRNLLALLTELEKNKQEISISYALGKQEPSLIRRDCGVIEKIIRQRQSPLNEHLQLKLAESHWSWIKIKHIKFIEINGETAYSYHK